MTSLCCFAFFRRAVQNNWKRAGKDKWTFELNSPDKNDKSKTTVGEQENEMNNPNENDDDKSKGMVGTLENPISLDKVKVTLEELYNITALCSEEATEDHKK